MNKLTNYGYTPCGPMMAFKLNMKISEADFIRIRDMFMHGVHGHQGKSSYCFIGALNFNDMRDFEFETGLAMDTYKIQALLDKRDNRIFARKAAKPSDIRFQEVEDCEVAAFETSRESDDIDFSWM